MNRDERQQLRAVIGAVTEWVGQDKAVRSYRADVGSGAAAAASRLRGAVVNAAHAGEVYWRVLPLSPASERDLGDLARAHNLPPIAPGEAQALADLNRDAAAALRPARALTGARRFISGAGKRDEGTRAADYLRGYHAWAMASGLPGLLRRLAPQPGPSRPVPAADALADWAGFAPRVADLGQAAMLPAATVTGLSQVTGVIGRAVQQESARRSAALQAGESVRRSEVRRMLTVMPAEKIKEVTRDRLRIGPLTSAGITTVQGVLDRGGSLQSLPGIAAASASQLLGAARTLEQTTLAEMPVRLDIKKRTPEAGELLRRLRAWDVMRKIIAAAPDTGPALALAPVARAMDDRVTQLVIWPGSRSAAAFAAAMESARQCARQVVASDPAAPGDDPWADFLRRPADYFALLSELGLSGDEEEKAHGDLPAEIVEAIRAYRLDPQYLTASLRGYQSFAARFALVQRRVIIGDEMGLGKTVEALAVLAHLRARGSHHSLVICPAAVVTNWSREVQAKSLLVPWRLHGPSRDTALRGWKRDGGVAVTTFDTLRWLIDQPGALPELGSVVVDEAHYIKNPGAQRSRLTAAILRDAGRVILLTGTPLENRIGEFRNLVGYLRRDLAVGAEEMSSAHFRRRVAPVYLRRNQEDVLTELPELVEVPEWLPMSGADQTAYRSAVAAGNFMAMRQAAMVQGDESVKMGRLREIVQEARDNGRRVIVFSHFRRVLDQVAQALPGAVFGPLTGSVPAAARQQLVDEFSAAPGGAVLVAQIVAGGVGLNIQAASVVVICEPQLKPTTEWQAIARARRMGQLESVQVHRLLSEAGVDVRVTEILERKSQLFNEFARISEMAGSAPEAYDLSEAEVARQVIAEERERLFATAPSPESPA